MQTECWSGMTDTEHTSGLNEEEHGVVMYIIERAIQISTNLLALSVLHY